MKFIKQKYLTIIFSIAGGIILGLTLTFALNVNATHLTAVLSSTQLLINYGALFNRELASDKQVIIIGNGSTAGFVGIGTTNPTQKLSVAGAIESTTGGFKFPDGSTMATNAHGSSTFSTSGTFTVPTGITAVWVTMTGGGGGGAGGSGVSGGAYSTGGGGGGASPIILSQRLSVTSGQNIAVTIGAGGTGGAGNGGGGASVGGTGGASSFGNISVYGGVGGRADSSGSTGGSSLSIVGGGSGSSGTYCAYSCIANGGIGGNSYFGVGGSGGYNGASGANGTRGSGGGGGYNNGGSISNSGGSGGSGYILVEW